MLRLGWSHRYKHSTVVITIWLTGTRYPYLKWQWILLLLCFLSCITANTLTEIECIWAIRRVSYQKQGLPTLREHLRSPRFFGGVRVAHLYKFCVVLLWVFTFLVLCCDVRYDFRIKTMFDSSLPPLVCIMSYLRYLCLFAYSGVHHTLCCVR